MKMNEEKYLKERDVMDHLRISRSTLFRLRMENGFPHQKVGEKLVRYKLTEIEDWIEGLGKSVPFEEKVNEKRDDEMPKPESQAPTPARAVAPVFRPKSGVFRK